MARYKKDGRGYFYTVIELKKGLGDGRRRKYLRAKTTARLKEKIEQFHADQQAGHAPTRSADEPTLAALLLDWLAGVTQRKTLRPSTLRRYETDIRNHLIPLIGRIKPRDLEFDHVQELVNRLHASGLAPRTVRNILSPLTKALDAARKRGLVRHNLVRDVELPKAEDPDLYQFAPDEMRRFLDAVRSDRFEALYWLSMLGFREGELLALRWPEVDLEVCTVRIVKGLQRVKQPEGKSKLTRIDPKTERSKRTVRFPVEWRPILLDHRAQQDELRSVDGWQEHDLVFPSTRGTPMEASNFVNRHFKPALRRAGLPAEKIRFHDMRHGAASMFIALGYDARTVADILGHSSPEFTLRQYAHSFEGVRDRATADVGALLKESGERVLELPPKRQEQ